MAVSQGGPPEQVPLVLIRFKNIVGIGNVTGPYNHGLYYWKTASKEGVDLVGAVLWPQLSQEKRKQFAAAAMRMNRQIPGPVNRVDGPTTDLEAAWAAGLFDGEGTFSVRSVAGKRTSWSTVAMSIPQASFAAVPETLTRFRDVVRVGSITGPRVVPSPWSKLPQYRWRAEGRHVVSAAAKVIWPWLGPVKRAEIRAAIEHLDPDVGDWMIDLSA